MEDRDYSISFLRILAMFMIVGCHIASFLKYNTIAMILSVGVEIFLIISGYLYSNKTIKDSELFIVQRFKKLYKPFIITTCIYIVYTLLTKRIVNLHGLVYMLFNLQGISFLFSSINISAIPGFGHTWFLTVILICYLLLILVKKIENKFSYKYTLKRVVNLISIFIIVDLLFVSFGVQLGYFLVFFIGYVFGKLELKVTNKMCFFSTICMILSLLIRLLGRRTFDDTIFYNNIIVIYTQTVLALWIFISIKWVVNKSKQLNVLSKSTITKIFESYSFYIYLTHYMFLVGSLSVSGIDVCIMLQLLIMIVLTILTAFIVKLIDDRILIK